MQPVSYSPCSPVLHSSCIALAAQEELAVAQLRVAYMCVEVGDALFLDHHITSNCNLFTHPQHLACLFSPHSGHHFFDIKRR